LCLGESTTADGYPDQLEEILNRRFEDRKITVINAGVPGTNTGIILTRLEANIDKYRPDIIVTMMGINDRAFSSPVEDEFYERDDVLYRTDSLRIYKLSVLLKEHIKYFFKSEDYKKNSFFPIDEYHDSEEKALGLSHSLRLERIRKLRESGKENILELIHTARSYAHAGKDNQIEKILNKILEIKPNNVNVYGDIFVLFAYIGKWEKSEKFLKKALELNPQDPLTYIRFANLKGVADYNYHNPEEIIATLRRAMLENPYNEELRHAFLMIKQKQRKNSEVIEHITSVNYRKVMDILQSRGIPLVAVQYPGRPVQKLKHMLGEEKQSVYFVDNEASFKRAVENEGYWIYFTDRFLGDFGHMTLKGQKLLAGNIADVIENNLLQ